jgi:transcriptional regulator with XRE-family HTH domain
MTPLEIKKAYKKLGLNQTSIAKSLGVTQPYISQIINGIRKTSRVRQAISEILGIPVGELWPDGDNNKNKSSITITEFITDVNKKIFNERG